MVEINSLNIKQEKQKFKTPFGVILCLEAKRWHSETVIETPFLCNFSFVTRSRLSQSIALSICEDDINFSPTPFVRNDPLSTMFSPFSCLLFFGFSLCFRLFFLTLFSFLEAICFSSAQTRRAPSQSWSSVLISSSSRSSKPQTSNEEFWS